MGKALNVGTNTATGGLIGYGQGGLQKGIAPSLVNKVTGGALSKIGNDTVDLLLGSKMPPTPNEVIDLASPQGRALQEQALGQYGDMLNQDVSGMANAQTAQQEQQARSSVEDQQRKAQELVAQRGLGGTSLGLNAILGQGQNLQNQIGAIRANAPGLFQQLRQQNLGAAIGGINQILGEQGTSKVLKMGQLAQPRGGGLLNALAPALGTFAGGYVGSGGFKKG